LGRDLIDLSRPGGDARLSQTDPKAINRKISPTPRTLSVYCGAYDTRGLHRGAAALTERR
jgi:hypothetical protein